jgi:hypothetical protein
MARERSLRRAVDSKGTSQDFDRQFARAIEKGFEGAGAKLRKYRQR